MSVALPTTARLPANAQQGGRFGPYKLSTGDLLFVGQKFNGSTAYLPAVYRSTDSGATWDAGTVSPGLNQTAGWSIDSQQVGDTIYVAFCINNGANTVTVYSYTVAGGWVRVDSGTGPVCNFGIVSTVSPVFLNRRSDGSFIVYYQGPTATNTMTAYRRVYYSRYSGGAWQTAVAVGFGATTTASHEDARALLRGPSDSCAFLFTRSTLTNLVNAGLDSANTLSGAGGITSTITNTDAYLIGMAPALDGNAQQRILFGAANAGTLNELVATIAVSGSVSASSTPSVEATFASTSLAMPGAMAFDGTSYYALAIKSSDSDLYWEKESAADTWANAMASELVGTWGAVNAMYDSGASTIRYIIGDQSAPGATVTYNDHSLAAAAVKPPRPLIVMQAVNRAASW